LPISIRLKQEKLERFPIQVIENCTKANGQRRPDAGGVCCHGNSLRRQLALNADTP